MIRHITKLKIFASVIDDGVKLLIRRSSTHGFLTKDAYKVDRGNFNYVKQEHIEYFKSFLGETRVKTNEDELEKYNKDWWGFAKGDSKLVLKPQTTEEVSKILKFCNENRLAICPQGGNTSVVASSVPVFDEIVLSMELLNKVYNIDDVSGVLVCDSGCILQNLNDVLSEKGIMMPQDMESKGSCQVGGNLSTNAGGIRLLRYGNTWCCVGCGSGLESYEKIIGTYKQAKFNLGEILSAMEVMDSESLILAKEKLNLKSPIGEFPFYLLIETSGSNEEHDTQKIESFLEYSLSKSLILNGTTTAEPSKFKEIWEIRERIPEAYRLDGYVFCYDFSLPLQHFYTIVDVVKTHMGPHSHRVFGFGHLGDANLHLQVSVKEFSPELKDMLEPFVFKKVKEMNGSISAEHGMGFLKAKYLDMVNEAAAVKLMKTLKETMDPKGIQYPYKVIPY